MSFKQPQAKNEEGSPGRRLRPGPQTAYLSQDSQSWQQLPRQQPTVLFSSQRGELPGGKATFLKDWRTGFLFLDTHPRFWQREGGVDWSHLRRVRCGRSWGEWWEDGCWKRKFCTEGSSLPSYLEHRVGKPGARYCTNILLFWLTKERAPK